MAEETNAGVAYLMALKRSAGPPAAGTEASTAGRGPGGRVTDEDVRRFAEAKPSEVTPPEVVKIASG